MSATRKTFIISAAFFFGLGVLFLVYFIYLEHQARQELPPEMRTPEAIQYYYDGSVCLGCDISGMISFMIFSSIGILILIIWGIYEAFSKKSNS